MSDFGFPLRAESDRKFFRRFIYLGIGALAFSAWCLYDGLVAWPKKNEIWAAYNEIPEADRPERWPVVAAEHDWPAKRPTEKKYHHTQAQINMQLYMAAPIALVGLWFFWGVWRSRGTWIAADEQGISSSWGQSFAWGDVTKIDKKKWRGKGIAKIYYTQQGASRVFVLDDFKFFREPTDAMLVALESHLERDQIVGGPTEAETLAAIEAEGAAEPAVHQQSPTN